jgi:hypothetical protein
MTCWDGVLRASRAPRVRARVLERNVPSDNPGAIRGALKDATLPNNICSGAPFAPWRFC